VIVDDAGHNPQDEQTSEVMRALRAFLTDAAAAK
jgi:pimeloyl-ACP methyl ester carboxylesterase